MYESVDSINSIHKVLNDCLVNEKDHRVFGWILKIKKYKK